jgi:tRNA(Ile)-lysidine synthase
MAMLHLCHRAGRPARAVTVDHGLRPEAAAEAALVARTCAALGIPHDVLRWEGPAPTGNLMDQARRARAALIARWAQGAGLGHVALAHTADDQAETLLMELSRSAGLDGLSGMRRRWQEGGVTWLRPLLAATRADLRAFLARHALPWAEDPTNDDDRFARVRARRALSHLAPLGITAAGLASVAGHLEASRRALDWSVAQAARAIAAEAGGALTLDRQGFLHLPADLRRRMLAAALRWIAGAPYAPRAAALARLEAAIARGGAATLAGVRLTCGPAALRLLRERRAVGGPVPVGEVWDGRWIVTGPPGEVRALGPAGLAQAEGWRGAGLPRDVLTTTPAVWQGEALRAAPLAGIGQGWHARIVAPFGRFPGSD